jgi:hypothetical protein
MIAASTKDEMQRAVYALSSIATKYNLRISVNETRSMAVVGKMDVRTKIVTNNNIRRHHISSKFL